MKQSKENNNYKIDIAIATKNGYPQLKKCIRCIVSNIKKPEKIIIIDNNDKISEKYRQLIEKNCNDSRVKLDYAFIPGIGLSNARNEAIKRVTSPYFAFVDQDEYLNSLWIKKVKLWFKKHSDVHVVSGPKKSSDPKTYWKEIWDFLYRGSFSYEGPTDFVASSNTCYQTKFIRKHDIKYDPRFVQSSEDIVFCHLLKRAGANIYFSKSIWLEHDFRSNFREFFKQWFKYGVSLYFFDTIYSTEEKSFFQKMFLRLKIPSYIELYFIPGFFVLNLALSMGFFWGLLTIKNEDKK